MTRADRHPVDALLEKIPAFRDFYWQRSAGLKRLRCAVLDRAGLLAPSSFVLWICTYACNYECSFCEASAGPQHPSELSTEEALALIGDIKRIRARRLLISGGEPLLRADLPRLVGHAVRMGLAPGLLSNGSLIEKRWPEIRSFPFFLFMTSIDGTREFHDRVRAGGAFDRALRSIELFASAGTPARSVKTVVQPGNIEQLDQLLTALGDSGATDWALTPALGVGRAAGQARYSLSTAQLRSMVEFVRTHQGNRTPRVVLSESHSYLQYVAGYRERRPFFCGAGLTRCAVMPNGDVLGCGQSYECGPVEGNIRTTPLSHTWRYGFRRYRRRVAPADCCGCEHWAACQGGCAAAWETGAACLKGAWSS